MLDRTICSDIRKPDDDGAVQVCVGRKRTAARIVGWVERSQIDWASRLRPAKGMKGREEAVVLVADDAGAVTADVGAAAAGIRIICRLKHQLGEIASTEV